MAPGFVFVTSRFGGDVTEIVVMNPDDGDVTRIGSGLPGDTPSWSSDGTRIAFVYLLPWDPDQPWMPTSFVSIINADGTGLTSLAWGHSPAWRPWTGGINDRPVAAFTFECSGLTCTFVSSSSDADGTIASYEWPFIGSGATVTRTFEGGHIYPVQLIVMDDDGALATSIQSVDLNQRPVVRLTASCIGLTCEFDGSASADLDGHITMFDWNFGDLIGRNGPAAMTHTYAAAGIYIVTLTARDNASGTGSYSETVTVVNPNAPPIAKFTSSCSGLVCSFNASTSSDPDGAIVSYAWTLRGRDDRFWCDGEPHVRRRRHLYRGTDRHGQRQRDWHTGPERHGRPARSARRRSRPLEDATVQVVDCNRDDQDPRQQPRPVCECPGERFLE